MSRPDYAAELSHAQKLAGYALEAIETMGIAETLPDELYSEEAVERIRKLIPYLIVTVTPQVEHNYLATGEPR